LFNKTKRGRVKNNHNCFLRGCTVANWLNSISLTIYNLSTMPFDDKWNHLTVENELCNEWFELNGDEYTKCKQGSLFRIVYQISYSKHIPICVSSFNKFSLQFDEPVRMSPWNTKLNKDVKQNNYQTTQLRKLTNRVWFPKKVFVCVTVFHILMQFVKFDGKNWKIDDIWTIMTNI